MSWFASLTWSEAGELVVLVVLAWGVLAIAGGKYLKRNRRRYRRYMEQHPSYFATCERDYRD